MLRARRPAVRFSIIVLGLLAFAQPSIAQPPPLPPLPPVPFPAGNPFSESKRVLGKILFWDEQLSSDNSTACGTCHKPAFNGTDPRLARNPSDDGILNTPDDVIGSPGVVRCDDELYYKEDAVFGFNRQITPRAANPSTMAMYAPDLFWDGRARTTFINPQTGAVSLQNGAALESQAVGPIVSDVEMGHEARDWNHVATKLATAVPMVLAEHIPSDIAAALDANPTFPQLFQSAFGDSAITAERIAFAIATYERTLVPNQSPFDRFNAGDANAMTPQQVQGHNALRASPCIVCHAGPQFTNNTFQNIGLRPVAEDTGRQIVTGNPINRGQFKVPTLRNVGLKPTYMHTGGFTTLAQVINFYANGAAQFPDNRSPILPVALPLNIRPAVIDFLQNALTDPRVATESFPFDRPRIQVDQAVPNPRLVGQGVGGTGGFVPRMIAVSPPNLMNLDFKIGVSNALGGAEAFVAWSNEPPVGGVLSNATLHGPITIEGTGAGEGFATWKFPIDETIVPLCNVYLQWHITDPAAAGGVAMSPIAHLRMIPYECASGDMNCDGELNGLDVEAFLLAVVDPSAYSAQYAGCDRLQGDFNADGNLDASDLSSFTWVLVRD